MSHLYTLTSSLPKCTSFRFLDGENEESLSLLRLVALIRKTACEEGVFNTLFNGTVIFGIALTLGGACLLLDELPTFRLCLKYFFFSLNFLELSKAETTRSRFGVYV